MAASRARLPKLQIVVQRSNFLQKDSGLEVSKEPAKPVPCQWPDNAASFWALEKDPLFTGPPAISPREKADNSGAALGTGSASKQLQQLLQELQGFVLWLTQASFFLNDPGTQDQSLTPVSLNEAKKR